MTKKNLSHDFFFQLCEETKIAHMSVSLLRARSGLLRSFLDFQIS